MAKQLESGYKGDIVEAINAAGGYATRIEDQYRVGVLDLILCMPSTGIVLAEAKRFTGQVFEPSPRQYIEMCAVEKGGGRSLLIGIKDEQFYLHGHVWTSEGVKGRVAARWCHVGTDFVTVFQNWHRDWIRTSK